MGLLTVWWDAFRSAWGVATAWVPPGAQLGRRALVYALTEQEQGAREMPEGSNGGAFVWKYTGYKSRGAWCAAFLYWCFLKSAGPDGLPFKRTHGAKALYKRIGRHGAFVTEPLAGDVVCWHRGAKGSGKGHIGIVSRVQGDTFWAVEGNKGRAGIVSEFRHEIGEGNFIGFARL